MNENEIKKKDNMFWKKNHLKESRQKRFSTCTTEFHEEGDINNGTE